MYIIISLLILYFLLFHGSLFLVPLFIILKQQPIFIDFFKDFNAAAKVMKLVHTV